MPFLPKALQPVTVLNATAGTADVREIRDLSFGPGPRDRLDLYVPASYQGRLPVVDFIYGGGWDSGDRAMYRFVGTALAARGFITVIADYRVYPEVVFPAFVEDAARAFAWIHGNIGRYSGDPNRIALVGHSAGAHIAALLALDPRWLNAEGAIPPETSVASPVSLAPTTSYPSAPTSSGTSSVPNRTAGRPSPSTTSPPPPRRPSSPPAHWTRWLTQLIPPVSPSAFARPAPKPS